MEWIRLSEIKRMHQDVGGDFFAAGATVSFRSRYPSGGWRCAGGLIWFHTSERYRRGRDYSKREYTVWVMYPWGDIEAVGELGKYSTSIGARRTAERYARASDRLNRGKG